MLSAAPSVECQRAQAMRQAAMQSAVSLSDQQTLQKAFKNRMRKEQEAFKDGEVVCMWRRVSVRQPDGSIDYKVGWSGPAAVISTTQNSTVF
eukprot:8729731-Pyramimonas_sp.AAC.1